MRIFPQSMNFLLGMHFLMSRKIVEAADPKREIRVLRVGWRKKTRDLMTFRIGCNKAYKQSFIRLEIAVLHTLSHFNAEIEKAARHNTTHPINPFPELSWAWVLTTQIDQMDSKTECSRERSGWVIHFNAFDQSFLMGYAWAGLISKTEKCHLGSSSDQLLGNNEKFLLD